VACVIAYVNQRIEGLISDVGIGLDSDESIRQEHQAALVRTAWFELFLAGKPSSIAGSTTVEWSHPAAASAVVVDSAAAAVRDRLVWNC